MPLNDFNIAYLSGYDKMHISMKSLLKVNELYYYTSGSFPPPKLTPSPAYLSKPKEI